MTGIKYSLRLFFLIVKFTSRDVLEQGGEAASILSKYYDSSLIKALKFLYPTYKWQVWKFTQVLSKFKFIISKVSKGYWKEPSNQKIFLDDLLLDLGHKRLDDW